MPTLTLRVQDETIYVGAPISVPNVGDSIARNGEVVRVEAVIWRFDADGAVNVQLNVGTQPYTF